MGNHTSSYLLKFAPSDLPKAHRSESSVYEQLMAPKAQGPWSRAFEEVRERGKKLTEDEEKDLKDILWSVSCERAKDTYWQWTHLPQPKVDGKHVSTFATLWIAGRVCDNENMKGYCDIDGYNKLGKGLFTSEWDA